MVAACFRFVLPEGTDWSRREIGGNYVWETRGSLDAHLQSDLYLNVVRKLGELNELRIYEVPEYVDNAQTESSLARAA
jgi:hypothetical protein